MKNHFTKIFFFVAVFAWGVSAASAAGFSDYYNPGSAESCPKIYQAFDCSPGYIISSTGTCKTKSEMDSKYASCQTYQKNSQKMGLQCDFRCKWAADPNSPSCASQNKSFDSYGTSGNCGTCLSGYVEYEGACYPTSEVIYAAGVGFLGKITGEIGSRFVNIFEPDSPDCGNGQLDGLEQCDGSAFRKNKCSEASAGVFIDTGSTLACAGSCVYDFTGCKRPTETTALCNNGSINEGEECDPSVNTQPKKCSEINSFYVDDANQTTTCNNNCSWNVTQCQYKTGGATITDPEPPPADQRRHYFLTANKYTGNLGGQSGANAKCNSDPKARNGVIYRALLATPGRIENAQIVSEAIYFGSVGQYWEGEDGSDYIGTGAYTTKTPPNHAMALEPFRLSGADADDGVNVSDYCNCYGLGGTSGLSRVGFLAGKMGNVSYDYAYSSTHGCKNTKTVSCSTNLPLLCVEDYKQSEVPPPPPSWHYFITTNSYTGNLGGPAGADAKCNSDPNRMPGRIYQAWIGDSETGWGVSGRYYENTTYGSGINGQDIYTFSSEMCGNTGNMPRLWVNKYMYDCLGWTSSTYTPYDPYYSTLKNDGLIGEIEADNYSYGRCKIAESDCSYANHLLCIDVTPVPIGQDACADVDCGDHGACVGGVCQCNTGFTGAQCNQCAEGYGNYPNCTPCYNDYPFTTRSASSSGYCDDTGYLPDGQQYCYYSSSGDTCYYCDAQDTCNGTTNCRKFLDDNPACLYQSSDYPFTTRSASSSGYCDDTGYLPDDQRYCHYSYADDKCYYCDAQDICNGTTSCQHTYGYPAPQSDYVNYMAAEQSNGPLCYYCSSCSGQKYWYCNVGDVCTSNTTCRHYNASHYDTYMAAEQSNGPLCYYCSGCSGQKYWYCNVGDGCASNTTCKHFLP